MRTSLLTVLMCGFLCAVSGTISIAQEKWPCIRVGEGEAEARIYATLETKIDIEFEEAPLDQVIDALASKVEIPIILDEKALAESGIGTDTPVSFQAKQITLKAAFRNILGALDLTFVIRDEVLQITTPDVASRKGSICLFNISEIAHSPQEIEQLTKIVEKNFSQPDSGNSILPIMFGNVLVIVGSSYEQDQVAEFLAALYKAQSAGATAAQHQTP